MNLKLPSLPDKDVITKFVPDIFRNLLVIYIILLVFSYISPGFVKFYIDMNIFLYLLIVLGAASLLFYAQRLEKSDLSGRVRFEVLKERISYAFLGLLLVLAVQSMAPETLMGWGRTPLTVAAVALGTVTFYLNRDKVEEIEEETRQEELEEKRREGEFAGKYPGIDRIWGVRWAVRWMYKEGWQYGGGLVGISIIGIFLRLWNLGKLGLWADEGTVYIASKNILLSGVPYLETGLLYARDYPHLYITAASLAIFGKSEFALRFPSAIFGTLLILIIYVLTKKVFNNKWVALLAAGIIATHPWLIEYSRMSRSYIMMVSLLYLSLLYFYKAYYEEKNEKVNLIIFGLLGFLTTLTHQLGQIILFLLPLALTRLRLRMKNLKYFLPFLSIFLGILIFRQLSTTGYMVYTDTYLETFEGEIPSLYERIPFGAPAIDNLGILMQVIPTFIIFAVSSSLFLLLISSTIRKKIPRYSFFPFVFLIFISTLFFSKNPINENKIILFVFPLVIILVAINLYIIKSIIKTKSTIYINTLPVLILLLTIFYAFDSYSTVVDRDYGDPVKSNYSPFEGFTFYQDYKTTIQYVSNHHKDGDLIIVYQIPQYWVFYGNKLPDYRVWTGTTATVNGVNVFTGTVELNNLDDLKTILKNNERIWVVTSVSILSYKTPRILHIKRDLIDYLDNFENNIVYISNDTSARVYLIENKSLNVSGK